MRGWLLGAALAATLVAGCFDFPYGCAPPVSARDAPLGAPSQSAGVGDHVRIRVLDGLDDSPLAGAGVAVIWNTERIEEPEDNETGGLPTNPPLTVVYLRTDEAGQASVDVVPERYYMVVAAADGWTEEWTDLNPPGSAAQSTHVLRLYPETKTWSLNATLAMDATDQAWHPHAFAFADSRDAADAMGDRLVSLDIALDWQVSPGEVADLSLVAGDSESGANVRAYTGPHVAPGRYTESLSMDVDQAWFDSSGFVAGPQTERPDVHLDPIAYTVTASARFDNRAVQEAECGILFADSETSPPEAADRDAAGLAGLGLLAVLGSVALWLQRSRR